MGIISVEQTNRLFWLGRYSERVYTTLRLYCNSYDAMIDEIVDSYADFCKMVDIPNVYNSKDEFRKKYPFDEENPDSIFSNLNRAYDNAIVLREEIGSEALSYIQLAIYDMNKASVSKAPVIHFQSVIDNLLAFWGIADDKIDSEQTRNIIKTGKRVERIDLYARLGMPQKELQREVHRLTPRIARSGMSYDEEKIRMLNELVETPEIDYYKIVYEVETIS
ncbi:MAG: alpha-E domain-containing protein [Lachnospiraceae bacterium]|nr:alpha-E domain-containing protein [Lachnospiraceae bacterium]